MIEATIERSGDHPGAGREYGARAIPCQITQQGGITVMYAAQYLALRRQACLLRQLRQNRTQFLPGVAQRRHQVLPIAAPDQLGIITGGSLPKVAVTA